MVSIQKCQKYRASKRLALSQPAISKAISDMERTLGAPLPGAEQYARDVAALLPDAIGLKPHMVDASRIL